MEITLVRFYGMNLLISEMLSGCVLNAHSRLLTFFFLFIFYIAPS